MALTKLTDLQPLHVHSIGISTFDGSVSVGGTLTYEDVTNVDAIGVVTARTGIKVLAGGINAVGVVTATSFSGDGSNLTGISAGAGGNTGLDLNDNVKIRLGTGNDLEIFHDGTHSRIDETGTGNLMIQSNNAVFIRKGTSETMAKFNVDGAVELYHDNVKKFETGAQTQLLYGNLQLKDGWSLYLTNGFNNASSRIVNAAASGTSEIKFYTQPSGGSQTERLHIQPDGDISFSNSATGAAQIKNVSGTQASVNGGGFPQYAFVGNEGTGMRRVSANTLAFDTSGNEQLRIDNTGDCLLLGGTLRIKDSGNSAQRGAIYGDASAFYINAGGNLKLFSGGGERVVFDNNGASTFKAKMNVDYTVSGSDYVAYFRNQNANCYGIQIQQPGSANAGYPLLACSNSAGGSHFRVDSGGLVYANSGTGTEKIAYFCRAWASITQTGSQTIRGSKGITSVGDFGTGYTRINLTNAQPDKNYSISVTGTSGNTSAGYAVLDTLNFGGSGNNEPTTTYFNIRGCQNTGSAGYDHPWITVAVFG